MRTAPTKLAHKGRAALKKIVAGILTHAQSHGQAGCFQGRNRLQECRGAWSATLHTYPLSLLSLRALAHMGMLSLVRIGYRNSHTMMLDGGRRSCARDLRLGSRRAARSATHTHRHEGRKNGGTLESGIPITVRNPPLSAAFHSIIVSP